MAFTPEDGSGKDDANSYVDVAFADGYFADRGQTQWGTAAQADREVALIKATDYIDKRFGPMFKGYRRAKQQALEWPRLDAYDEDGFAYDGIDIIPRTLQKACAEYALRALQNGPLAPDPAAMFPVEDKTSSSPGSITQATGGAVTKQKSKVGPIEEEFGYSDPANLMQVPGNIVSTGIGQVPNMYILPYPAADMLIEELLESSRSIDIGRG